MKKFLTTFSIVAALVALSSCNKEIEKTAPETTDSVRTVHFTAGPVTKTVFGEISGKFIPTLWTENHSVAISLDFNSFKKSSVPEISEDGKKATFSADFESSTGTFYAVSPYAALPGYAFTSSKAITVEIVASQTPLEKSVDEKVQILVAKKEVTSESISEVAFSFEHFTAYGKLGFSNLSLAEGEKVASVSLTAEENWAGRFYYYFENNTFAVNSAGKTINLTTDKTTDIWFACAPVDLSETSLSVVITTDKGTTYSRTVDIPKDRKFESGHVSSFTIDMSGIKADGAVEYELVTDASMLSVGSQVIIAASNYDFAISTAQNTKNNYRERVDVTKSSNKIVSPGPGVQIFEVEQGVETGTWAFKCVNGDEQGKYIYASGGSNNNYLNSQESKDAAGSWKISITSNGVATLEAQGGVSRNLLKYNHTNSRFSCYASGQQDVSIYMLHDDRESVSLTFPKDSYELEVDSDEYSGFKSQTAIIEPSSLAGKVVYSISDDSNVTSGFNTTNGSFTLTGNAGTATITASYAGDDNYKSAQASYTVKVYATGGEETEETITFSEYYSEITDKKEIDGEEISGNDFSIVFSKGGNATTYYANGTAVRWYYGSKFTVSSETKTITKIVINYSQTATNTVTSNVGSYQPGDEVGTWNGNDTEVVFSQSGTSGHYRISSITVTCK